MNNNNIRYWEEDGFINAEWGDCALDDEDRNKGILFSAKGKTYEEADTALVNVYDNWIRETR